LLKRFIPGKNRIYILGKI